MSVPASAREQSTDEIYRLVCEAAVQHRPITALYDGTRRFRDGWPPSRHHRSYYADISSQFPRKLFCSFSSLTAAHSSALSVTALMVIASGIGRRRTITAQVNEARSGASKQRLRNGSLDAVHRRKIEVLLVCRLDRWLRKSARPCQTSKAPRPTATGSPLAGSGTTSARPINCGALPLSSMASPVNRSIA